MGLLNTGCALAVALAGLVIASPAVAYEEHSYAQSADLFFVRVGEPTSVSFPSLAAAKRLTSLCRAGRTLLVESGPLACACGAEPEPHGRPEELLVTLRCQAGKGTPAPDAIVLASASAVRFDEHLLGELRPLSDSLAKPVLEFLKSADPGLRKHLKNRPLLVYALPEASRQYWLVQTETRVIEEAGCETSTFQVVARRGGAFELVGSASDVDAVVSIKADGWVGLRASNRCDGVQADLYDLTQKVGVRASLSGH